jgi:RNA polymerase sigma-70 factor (ECF subfamily)
LVRSKDAYRVKASFRTFIYRIARNLWIDRYRSEKSRPRPVSLNSGGKQDGERSMEERLEGNEPHPGARLERDETREILAEAIAALPEVQREVFVLWLETGMKYAEISKVLGIPVGTIKSRMHTAMHGLKDKLEKRTGER